MGKKIVAALCLVILCVTGAVSCAGTAASDAQEELEDILSSYAGEEAELSAELQVILDNVNFRESPGGKVLGQLQGGDFLECLDEVQHKGDLWYFARSEEYGDGYVTAMYAKPVWDDQGWWLLNDGEDLVTDNMLLFAYWMGTYQLDHGLSAVEAFGSGKQLTIAPATVRGDESVIPEDMRIQLVLKLYEYGFVCMNSAYDRLRDESLTFEEKNDIAASVLRKHYGTDDIWQIITGQSIVLFIHRNDLHARPEGPLTERDEMLTHAVMERIISEH